jgi:hypothetical protein
MHRPRVRILLSTLLAAFAAAGCESSTLSPDDARGTFVLETYDGNAVPATLGATGVAAYILVADTMRLGRAGEGAQVRARRVDYHDPARPDEQYVSAESFRYRVRGGRLSITNNCPIDMLCAGLRDVGTHEGDALVLDFGDGGVRRYRRIED